MERTLDVEHLRGRFPALARRHDDGGPVAYLDGAGGAQVPETVIDAIGGYLARSNANTDGAFATSRESDAMIEEARGAAADLLGVARDEVAFGASATTLNFLLAHAVARTLRPGDEILTTALDHDANIAPWLLVARDHGLVVRTVPLRAADGTLDHAALNAMVGERTRVIACTAASNALGSITPMADVAAAAKRVGALLWVDAVHLAPHRRIADALGADVLLTSAYKYFGPHIAVAAIRREHASSWPADRVRPAAETPAGHRFEAGTLNHEALAGFVATVEYLESLGSGGDRRSRLDDAFARIEQSERALTSLTLERLARCPGLRLYGIADPDRASERTPTFCFRLDGWSARRLSEALGRRGIFTWDGNYYALEAMTELGLEASGGAVRASYLHYTTADEVHRLCDALEDCARETGA